MIFTRLPFAPALFKLRVRKLHIEGAVLSIQLDNVTIMEKSDRTTDGRFRPDMADAEAARGAGKTPIGDERHFVAHPLPVKRRRGREHLAHTGAAARALVADDQHLAFFIFFIFYRLEAGF